MSKKAAKKKDTKPRPVNPSLKALADILLSLTTRKAVNEGVEPLGATFGGGGGGAQKPSNPPRTEIDPIVKALLSAKSGKNARGIDNNGNPQPLGLDSTSFMELLGPFNAVVDNYHKSKALTAADMKNVYSKLVKNTVDMVHGACQEQ